MEIFREGRGISMVKNSLGDLNLYLFEQLERIMDDSLTAEELEKEMLKSRAISKIASQVIANGNLVLRAKELEVTLSGRSDTPFPKMLEG